MSKTLFNVTSDGGSSTAKQFFAYAFTSFGVMLLCMSLCVCLFWMNRRINRSPIHNTDNNNPQSINGRLSRFVSINGRLSQTALEGNQIPEVHVVTLQEVCHPDGQKENYYSSPKQQKLDIKTLV